MSYKSRLIRTRHARSELSDGVRKTEPHRMTGQDLHSGVLEYRLDCGRTVRLQECHISLSTIGFLAGSTEAIRAEVIRQLPERVRSRFPNYGIFIKPLRKGELPAFTFMLALTCDHPVSDPTADSSNLVVCWLSHDIETSLPELIAREICALDWDEHAVDFNL